MSEQVQSPVDLGVSREGLLDMYYYLRLARSLEEQLVALFRQTKVIGGIYRCLGQEGESVGTAFALDFGRGDVLSPLIRNMGAILRAGAKPVEIFRQYMSKGNGPSRGRDLNIHFQDLNGRGFMGPISPLGDMVSVMAGVVLARRMQKKEGVAMVYIGDGASSTGAFYEGMNFATVQKLPLVVIIENNGWAYSTPTYKQTAAKTLADKAYAFGCASETVDGNDTIACYHAAKRAVDRARAGEGVTLLEVVTFRMKGHAEHDDQSYVPPEMIEEWRSRDPVERFERDVLASGLVTAEDFKSILERIKAELSAARDEAEASPMPLGEEAQYGVYYGDGFWDRPAATEK
ncbi:MAG TPA: thiamine pyrophosphate-dependent dehydrogenase E1 component subunit alpha [Thermoanaerobaculia bacterium]|nr:thiamine pyrophosphate-dependent dehydrogenase E1 component subunit alpha [Thermoanaerobaculia bacterium]